MQVKNNFFENTSVSNGDYSLDIPQGYHDLQEHDLNLREAFKHTEASLVNGSIRDHHNVCF